MTVQAPDDLASGPAATPGGLGPVLVLEEVSKTYPATPPVGALRQVSLTVHPGELAAIVGPSGSGKSTLLHVMGTLDRPSAGTVHITGLDTARMTDHQLAWMRATRIGFVFQQPFLAEHSTVLDNVADGLQYAGIRLTARRQQAAQALHWVGLDHKLTAHPTQLSGGERQRVGIARALAGRPAIVLADEPTGSLDSVTGQSILALFAELNAGGATIIVVTHDQAVAARMPRRLTMLDGRIITDTPAQALPAPPGPAAPRSARGADADDRTARR